MTRSLASTTMMFLFEETMVSDLRRRRVASALVDAASTGWMAAKSIEWMAREKATPSISCSFATCHKSGVQIRIQIQMRIRLDRHSPHLANTVLYVAAADK